jgi:hypothetical protein
VASRLGAWRGEEVAAGKVGEDDGGFNKGSSEAGGRKEREQRAGDGPPPLFSDRAVCGPVPQGSQTDPSVSDYPAF